MNQAAMIADQAAIDAAAGVDVLIRVQVFDDVLARRNRRELQLWVPPGSTSVRQLIDRVRNEPAAKLGSGVPLAVLVNGRPLRDAAPEWDAPITAARTELMLAPSPGGFGITEIILIAIAIASAAASAYLIAGIQAPAASGSRDPEGRRFGFGRVSTDPVVGESFIVPLGRIKRLGGKVIARVPGTIGSDGSERVRILVDLGLGPIAKIGSRARGDGDFNRLGHEQIAGVYLNDQPLINFPSVKISGRFGTSGQRPLPGFRDTEVVREAGVGGVELVNTSGSERTGGSASGEAFAFTTLDPVDAVLIRIRFDRGLYALSGQGQVNARRVRWRWRTRPTGGAWGAWNVVVVERADQSEVFTLTRADELNAGGAASVQDVEVERVTPDAAGATTVDHMLLTDIVEVRYSNNTYAGHAVVGVEIVASEELGTIPRLSFDVDGYDDCRVWDGTSTEEVDGETRPVLTRGWSNNPLDLALEVMTNTTWGSGYGDDDIFWDSWMAERSYAAESVPMFGGGSAMRPRFACNLVMDEAREDIEWIRAILNTAQCRPYEVGGQWGFVTDRARAEAAEFFGDGDIARGPDTAQGPGKMLLSFKRVDTSPEAGVANQLVYQFENELAGRRGDVIKHPKDGELWLGAGWPGGQEQPRPRSFRLDGVTDPEQVLARMVYELDRTRGLSRTLAFTTTKRVVGMLPGERFDMACSVLGWGTASGRVRSGSTAAAVVLDRSVVLFTGVAYQLQVSHLNGNRELVSVTAAGGSYPAGTPIAVAGLAAVPAEGASYSVGPTDLATKPFTCTKIELQQDDLLGVVWRVEGLEYSAQVYDLIPGNVQLPDYSDLGGITNAPGPVQDLRGSAGTVNGIDQVGLSWRQAPQDAANTGSFRIYRRSTGTTTWILIPMVVAAGGRRAAVIEIADRDTAFDFCVIAVSLLGAALSPYDPRVPVWSTVFGLSAPPPPPPDDLAANQVGDTYRLSWTPVDGAVGYQVLAGGDTGTGRPNNGAEDCLVIARTIEPELVGLNLPPGRACRFWVRSVGPSGRLSWTASTVQVATPATPAGKSILQTEVFDLSSVGTLSGLAWDGTDGRLELSSPGTPGTWTSPVKDVGSAAAARQLTIRPATANDAADPTLAEPTWPVPSINADQWGVVSGSGDTAVVGMLMPPWPDNEQAWVFEVRTSTDSVTWSSWAPLALGGLAAASFRYWQVRATLSRLNHPYRPALRGLAGVVVG
jgi:hypothetical protein